MKIPKSPSFTNASFLAIVRRKDSLIAYERENSNQTYVSASFKKFYFLGETSNRLVHVFLTRDFSCYMPKLIECHPQPQKSAKGMKFYPF